MCSSSCVDVNNLNVDQHEMPCMKAVEIDKALTPMPGMKE